MDNTLLTQAFQLGVECKINVANKQYPNIKKGDVLMLHVRAIKSGKIQYYNADARIPYHKSCTLDELFTEITPTDDFKKSIILEIIG